jgi:enoyl-CoA hydratase/carnithine racemase
MGASETPGSERVRIERRDGVGVLSLNRPERHNAVDDAMFVAFAAALDALVADPGVRCILIRGEGRSFCSGRDVSALGQRSGGESHLDFIRHHQDARLRQLESSKPIVAAVRGYALGAGCEIAIACDLRIAAADAQFAVPEIDFGIVPDTGGTQVLTALIGPARAKFMVLTGKRIDAATALQWGLVEFVVPPERLDEEAFALAATIAAKAPMAAALAKQLIDGFHGDRVRHGIREELVAQVALFESADYAEARAALRERRPPRFQGR